MADRDAPLVRVLYADGADGERVSRTLADRPILSVETVATAAAALERVEDEAVDCVVSAQRLADGTGLELLRSVREREPHLPFVLYPRRAGGSERLASEATAADVSVYLPRSIDDDACDRLTEHLLSATDAASNAEQMRRERSMFNWLMDNLPVSIYFKDEAARHVRASSLVGPAPESISPIGKTDPELYGEACAEAGLDTYEDDLHVIETGEAILEREEAWTLDQPGGDRYWFRSTKIPWRDDDGEIRGLVGVTRDVTAEKRFEATLERQLRRLDRIASVASHDVRNSLNIAMGYLELGRETGEERAFEEAATALENVDERLEDLLSMAREDVGEATTAPLELAPLLESVADDVAPRATTVDVGVPADAVIDADEALLRRLFENLFQNAIEHVGPAVQITVGTTETGFVVEADGREASRGPPDRLREDGDAHGSGRIGMGLAIVEQIVAAHDWTLSIREGTGDGEGEGAATRLEVDDCLLVSHPAPELEPPETFVDEEVTPADVVATDVGGATPAGDVALADGQWVVTGGGRNVWRGTDEAHVVYAPLDGDGRIVARLVDVDCVTAHTKAGVVIRAAPEAGAPLGYLGVVPEPRTEVLWRERAGEEITGRRGHHPTELPRWLRLERRGDLVTGYTSGDGETWRPVDQRRVALGEEAVVGLLVCSHDPGERASAVFESVSVVER